MSRMATTMMMRAMMSKRVCFTIDTHMLNENTVAILPMAFLFWSRAWIGKSDTSQKSVVR
jgi:hypothetical protein